MEMYISYNLESTARVEEKATVTDRKVYLRHIPKQGSIEITDFWGDPAGIIETTNREPAKNRFFCDYALDSLYRDANRTLIFNSFNEGDMLTFTYTAIGTVITADDMNELKAHLENSALHGNGAFFSNNTNKMIAVGSMDNQRHDDLFWEGSELAAIDAAFTQEVGRAPNPGDIVQFYLPGNDVLNILRTQSKWWNLDPFTNGQPDWLDINPFLTAYDRQKLDALPATDRGFFNLIGTFSDNQEPKGILSGFRNPYFNPETYEPDDYRDPPKNGDLVICGGDFFFFDDQTEYPNLTFGQMIHGNFYFANDVREGFRGKCWRRLFWRTGSFQGDKVYTARYNSNFNYESQLFPGDIYFDGFKLYFKTETNTILIGSTENSHLKAQRDELSSLNQQINDLRKQLAADRKLLDYLHLQLDSELGDD